MSERGASEQPRNLVERAASAAMDAVDAVLEAEGATCTRLYIAFHADEVPLGELDAVSAAHGSEIAADLDERARDVFTFLISQAVGTGKALGLDVKVVPLRGGPES